MPRQIERGLHRYVVRTVAERILLGQYGAGEVIDPHQLEIELGASRTVIREALRVLAAKGMVDARPNRGTIVRARSDWSLLDPDLLQWRFEAVTDWELLDQLAEVRRIVEPAGASLAAQRRTEDDLRGLEQAMEDMRAAGHDSGPAVDADASFHKALLSAAHNEILERIQAVIEVGLRARDALVHGGIEWRDPVPDHLAVLEAVKNGDPDAARDAVLVLLDRSAIDQEKAIDKERLQPTAVDGSSSKAR